MMKFFSSVKARLVRTWRMFWLQRAGYGFWGRMGSRLASLGVRGSRCRYALAVMTPKGYIHPEAEIIDVDLRLGSHVFIGERALIARWGGDGFVELRDGVQINRECTLEIAAGGSIIIGPQVGIESGCVFFSGLQPIIIRPRAEIASYCAFFSYDHGMASGREIYGQPITSKGPIIVEEDAWLGVGVTVLSGVTIGRGAVIGAGSVVSRDIPAGAIAVGAPARVVKYR
jgi:acetyltransferase-like isoleucine patch superfamily enzyme